MNKIFKKNITIRISFLIAVTLVLGLLITGYFYFTMPVDDSSLKLEAILASLIAGLFVAIIQFTLSWQSFRANEKITSLGIKEILITRDDRQFYEDYLNKASKEIDMMGTTGQRFLNDFADLEQAANLGAKTLINKLDNKVIVRILMPKKRHLTPEDKKKAEIANEQMKKLSETYENFNYRYYNHIPTHSVFRVDNENIVGPIFPIGTSKNTPAIYLDNSSPYASKYQENFVSEWDKADIKL